jgi:predicted DsbA family dithiol-disulfide isomerase
LNESWLTIGVRIDVWGDVTCPWCRAGKARLDEAVAALEGEGGPDVEVVWRPFAVEGFAFDAQRLLAVARQRGGPALQEALLTRFFQVYHDESADLTDPSLLARVAEQAGLRDAAALVAGDEGADQVRADLDESRVLGIRTAPTFVVDGRAVGGAQPTDVLLDLLKGGAPPEDPDFVRFRNAEILVDGNDPLGALKVLAPLLERHGEEYSVRLLAARAYFASAQLNRARATLEKLVEERPVDDYARFMLGRVAERQSRAAEARSHYRVAVAMSANPAYREALDRINTSHRLR